MIIVLDMYDINFEYVFLWSWNRFILADMFPLIKPTLEIFN